MTELYLKSTGKTVMAHQQVRQPSISALSGAVSARLLYDILGEQNLVSDAQISELGQLAVSSRPRYVSLSLTCRAHA